MINQQRAELSKKNPYWIPREKYYELLYFTRQYDTMRQEIRELRRAYPELSMEERVKSSDISNPVEKAAQRIEELHDKMTLIEDTVREVGPDIYKWLLVGVTTMRSYEYLNKRMGMPAARNTYYDRYRKYFYYLAQKR